MAAAFGSSGLGPLTTRPQREWFCPKTTSVVQIIAIDGLIEDNGAYSISNQVRVGDLHGNFVSRRTKLFQKVNVFWREAARKNLDADLTCVGE